MSVLLTVVALALPAPEPAVADVVVRDVEPAPRHRALERYTDLWRRCARMTSCDAPRNVRRDGVRFKWVSEDRARRHWAERPARARDVGSSTRRLRVQLERLSLTPYRGPGGSRWAVPWYIVACESGGSWGAWNPSGAIGPYQLLGKGAPWPASTPRLGCSITASPLACGAGAPERATGCAHDPAHAGAHLHRGRRRRLLLGRRRRRLRAAVGRAMSPTERDELDVLRAKVQALNLARGEHDHRLGVVESKLDLAVQLIGSLVERLDELAPDPQ